MWRPDPELLARQLTTYFGIELGGHALPSGGGYPAFELFPTGCAKSDAFKLACRTKWRSLEFEFEPGAFAGELVAQMGAAPAEKVELFQLLASKCAADRGKLSLAVNGTMVVVERPDTWPPDWRRVELRLAKSAATVNTENYQANDDEVFLWARRFAGLVFALIPIEESADSVVGGHEGLPEGSVVMIEVNRYERSRINRAACIELHGATCKICGFSFADTYGTAGDGFIHVHHVTPVSLLGPGYRVNPGTDLVPLCANCHAMAHRRTPPYSLDELRALLR